MKNLKKIFILLIIFISFIAINTVKADMSAPELRPYEVVVTNPSGIDYYNYKGEVAGHLNKDDKVYVIYEYDGKYTLGVKTTKYGFESQESIGTVSSLDGFSLIDAEVDPTTLGDDNRIIKTEDARKALVYTSDGVDVLRGPSETYEKVGHLKKDTTLAYKYRTDSYIYIEYDNIKGWINILKGKVLIENDVQYIFREDYDTKCGIIPKNSITTPIYKTDQWEHKALFTINNCSVLLDTFRDDTIIDIYPVQQRVKKDVTLYKYADSNSEVVTTIPNGTEITLLAGGDFMAGTESVRYIKYNDVTGWALDDDSAFEWINTNEEKEPEKIEDTIKIEDIELPKKPEVEEPMAVEMPRSNFSLVVFIILCAFGASVLVATAIVVIILINKSSKSKKEEPKETKKYKK